MGVGCAVRFNRPAGQQQTENDTENQLFLFRQAVHGNNLMVKWFFGKSSRRL